MNRIEAESVHLIVGLSCWVTPHLVEYCLSIQVHQVASEAWED